MSTAITLISPPRVEAIFDVFTLRLKVTFFLKTVVPLRVARFWFNENMFSILPKSTVGTPPTSDSVASTKGPSPASILKTLLTANVPLTRMLASTVCWSELSSNKISSASVFRPSRFDLISSNFVSTVSTSMSRILLKSSVVTMESPSLMLRLRTVSSGRSAASRLPARTAARSQSR